MCGEARASKDRVSQLREALNGVFPDRVNTFQQYLSNKNKFIQKS
jgi:hypothetical protein